MVKIGDKIKMTKHMEPIDTYNMIFDVTNITRDLITIKNKYGFGFMQNNVEEFNKYFVKIRQWTPWIKSGFIEYKTDNEKYVYVKYKDQKAKASCNLNCDVFDLETGIMVALSKLSKKCIEGTRGCK